MRAWLLPILLLLSACGADGAPAGPPPADAAAAADGPAAAAKLRIAVLADTHIIDEYYTGPENTPVDTESIFHTKDRLEQVRATINGLSPAVEAVLIAGDFVHNYPSTAYDFYFSHTTRWDVAKTIIDGFRAPVYPGLGNHDYDIPDVPFDFTHRLFAEKIGREPYYAVKLQGWKFLMLNNMLGVTWDPTSPRYDSDQGSFGKEQLAWLDRELAEGLPSILVFHYGLYLIEKNETDDPALPDIFALLAKHGGTVKLVLGGHTHTWLDFEMEYGVRHFLLGGTRYDADNYVLLDLDAGGAVDVVNWSAFGWVTMEASPWPPPG
jgi:predicted MPP superfamily phosphohydrolase